MIIEHNKSSITVRWKYSNLIAFAVLFLGLMVIFSYGVDNVSAASNVSDNNIYIDTHGNDSWNGLSATHSGLTGPKLTIQNATQTVNKGGTINIANGYYSKSKDNNITIDKNMNIRGQSKTGTIITGSNTNWIFYILPGVNATISNLSLINGTKIANKYTDNNCSGGAINNRGNLKVYNCNLKGNHATATIGVTAYGGAIYNTGYLTTDNSGFTGNIVTGTLHDSSVVSGGAIYNMGYLNINKTTFNDNTANGHEASGGAVTNDAGSLIVNESTFTNNTAIASMGITGGGAISNNGSMTVTYSNFTMNNAKGWYDTIADNTLGGAIYNVGGSLARPVTISNSNFIENIATNGVPRGGAVYNKGVMSLINCNFTGNTAFIGGAIDNDYGTMTVFACKFTNNVAKTNGSTGGAINNYGTLTATSNTFKNNTADDGGAIYTNNTSHMHFNQFIGNKAGDGGAIESGGGIADASLNWWGTNAGPTTNIFGNVTVSPWLVLKVIAKPNMPNNSQTTVTANLLYDNNGVYHNPLNGHELNGIPVTFTTTLGTITSPANTVNGSAISTFKSGSKIRYFNCVY